MAAGRIGFITDCEGNFDYWRRCVDLSEVVGWSGEGDLVFMNDAHRDVFVFGGDVFDKGPGAFRDTSEETLVDLTVCISMDPGYCSQNNAKRCS